MRGLPLASRRSAVAYRAVSAREQRSRLDAGRNVRSDAGALDRSVLARKSSTKFTAF
jgi:hypothetical protein